MKGRIEDIKKKIETSEWTRKLNDGKEIGKERPKNDWEDEKEKGRGKRKIENKEEEKTMKIDWGILR